MIKWDNKNIKKLENLVKSGLSPVDIGNIFNTSRNAIIGKCSRLGWILAKSRNHKSRRHLTTQYKKPKQRSYLKSPIEKSSVKVKTRKFLKIKDNMNTNDKAIGMDKYFIKLGIPSIPDDKHCHYITGDDIKNGNHTWCNRPTHNNSVYCEYHHKELYVVSYRSKPQNRKPILNNSYIR